jgi:hypothetical protein
VQLMRESVRLRRSQGRMANRKVVAFRGHTLTAVRLARLLLVALVLATVAGCVSRRPLVQAGPATLPADQEVEVWQHGQARVLRHVSVDSSTIRALVRPWRPGCDSCRIAIARAEADSLVLVNRETGWVVGGTIFLFWAWRSLWNCYPFFRCGN